MVKKLILIFMCFFIFGFGQVCYANDAAHRAVSAVAAGFGVMLVDILYPDAEPWQKWLGASLIGITPGVIKELSDDKFDWKDMGNNALGAATGSATVLTITWTW